MTWTYRQTKLGPGYYRITHFRVAAKPTRRCACGRAIHRGNKTGACAHCRELSNADVRKVEREERARRGLSNDPN
jgi:hypothetical protein